MIRQYHAMRFRGDYPMIGTIPVGEIIYIQDNVRPLRGISGEVVMRDPWIIEAWLNRESYTGIMAGGHLAVVRSLRTGRRTTVADWILLYCVDAGLVKETPTARRTHTPRILYREFQTGKSQYTRQEVSVCA